MGHPGPELCLPRRLDESEDMHSLLLTESSTLLVGGLQSHVLEIDLNTVQETQKVQAGRRQGLRSPGAAWAGNAYDARVTFLFLWSVGRIILTGFSRFPHSTLLRHLESLS